MSYNSTTKTISSPVSCGDVSTALGTTSLDVGTLCKHTSVNKWARYKPMEALSTSTAALTENDRMEVGSSRGCYYGNKVTVTTNNLSDLHSADWSWDKPTTWFRLLDFSGYNHAATLLTQATMPAIAYVDLAYSFEVSFKLAASGAETSALPVRSIIEKVTGATLENLYAFLLVGSYYCAMCDSSKTVNTLGNYTSTYMLADLSTLTGLSADSTIQATVFLGKASLPDMDYTGKWVNASLATLSTSLLATMPNAVNISIPTTSYMKVCPAVATITVTWDTTNILVTVTSYASLPETDLNFTVKCNLTYSAGSINKTLASVIDASGLSRSIIFSFTWTEIGVLVATGTSFPFKVNMYSIYTQYIGTINEKWTTGVSGSYTATF